MNDSIEKVWFEQVPKEWSVQRMKNILSPKGQKSISGQEELLSVTISEGVIKRSEYLGKRGGSRALSLVGYKVVNKNNLVNNIMKMGFRCLGVSRYDGIVSPAYSVFKIDHAKAEPTFLNYLLRTNRYVYEYRKLSKGIQESRMRLYDDYFLAMDVIVPPITEQRLISKYLDKKTKQIAKLVKKIQRKIELLKEQQTSLINHYLIKGLSPNVEMKDSGVELIGEIPKHWKLGKIKYLSNLITKGTTPSNVGEDFDENGQVRFIKAEDLLDGFILPIGSYHISENLNEKLKRSQLKVGDLLIVIAGTLGKCAIVNAENLPANINQAISLIRMKDWANSNYVRFWFETSSCKKQIAKLAVSVAQPNISMEDLGNIIIPIISKEEQKSIEKLVRTKVNDFDLKLEKERKRLLLLSEFRQSLISSVVTGKTRIRENVV